MNRMLAALAAALLLSQVAEAQTADHLQCFKIKDSAAKAAYQADLTPTNPAFPLAAGCTISIPAKLLCVDAVKDNVTPAPPGSPPGGAAQSYLCYKTKCPKATATVTVTDQFGSHPVVSKSTGFACAPIDTVPVTTTTLAPSCTDGLENGTETDVDCGGGICATCGNGAGCALASDCTSGSCSAGICAAPSCTDGLSNGSETGVDCGGGVCPACAPGQACAGATDCASGICSANVCVAALANGAACSTDGQCASTRCVDGVCCNSACNGTCQACTAVKKGSGSDGTCGGIAAGIDPDSECTTSAASTCGTDGFCSGMATCELYPNGTNCAAASCVGETATLASQCNGGGTCVPGMMQPCSPYNCGPTTCKTTCASVADCATGFTTCSAGVCLP